MKLRDTKKEDSAGHDIKLLKTRRSEKYEIQKENKNTKKYQLPRQNHKQPIIYDFRR